MQEKCLLSGSCETQIGVCRECCSLLNNSWFDRVLTFSIVLETIGRREIGLKFLGSVLVPFLQRGLSFATSQSLGK